MRHETRKWIAIAAAAAVLSGCGGSETDGGLRGDDGKTIAFCETIVGAGAAVSQSVSPLCVDCAVADEAAAADDNGYTYAVATVNGSAPGEGVAIRATAPSGTIFAQGHRAGVFLSLPSAGNLTLLEGPTVTVNTFLAGALQETATSALTGLGSLNRSDLRYGGDELPDSYYWFDATKPFDAVEALMSNGSIYIPGGRADFKLYELCYDGGVM